MVRVVDILVTISIPNYWKVGLVALSGCCNKLVGMFMFLGRFRYNQCVMFVCVCFFFL